MAQQQYVPVDDLGVRLDEGCPECGHKLLDAHALVSRRETHTVRGGVLSFSQLSGSTATIGYIELVCGDCDEAFVADGEQVYEPS